MKKFFKFMSESAGSSNSRVAMSVAFKRARQKFPKNFGDGKKKERVEDLPAVGSPEKVKNLKAPETVTPEVRTPETDLLPTSVIDSLEQVVISDEIGDELCDVCQHESKKFITLEEITALNAREEIENDGEVQKEKELDNAKSHLETGLTATEDNNSLDETSYSFVWKEEPVQENVDNIVIKQRSIQSSAIDKSTNVTDSDVDTRRIVEIHPRYYDGQLPRRCKSHRCSKRTDFQEDKYAALSDDVRSSPSCTNLQHHCHCHHRHCCCRIHHCCYSRCCLYWQQPNVSVSAPSSESSTFYRKSSMTSHRRTRKEKCSICRKLRASSPIVGKSSSRHGHRDSCSRDSGIFTNVIYGNDGEYEEEEEDEDDEDNALQHKDSLSILQEKYNLSTGNRKSEGRRRCEEEDRSRSHKFCRRLASSYEASY